MSQERKRIRQEVISWLKGKTSAGAEVFGNRAEPFWAERTRGIAVYTLDEDVTIHSDTSRVYERALSVAVEMFHEARASEDQIDDLCHEVECCVEPRIHSLNGLALRPDSDVSPGSDEKLDVNPSKSGLTRVEVRVDAEGRQLLGTARLVWTVFYGTERSQEALADPQALTTLHATVDLGDENVEADVAPPDPES